MGLVRYGIGVDPGIHGAIAAVYESASGRIGVDCYDMPTLKVEVSGKLRDRIDVHRLDGLIGTLAAGGPGLAVQEEVHARPIRRGPKVIKPNPDTMLQLGKAAGYVLALLAAHRVPFRLITPRDWKSALDIPANKDEARLAASRLMPDGADQWILQKHDGRAEAALLGLYALRQMAGVR